MSEIHDTIPPLAVKIVRLLRSADMCDVSDKDATAMVAQMVTEHVPLPQFISVNVELPFPIEPVILELTNGDRLLATFDEGCGWQPYAEKGPFNADPKQWMAMPAVAPWPTPKPQ